MSHIRLPRAESLSNSSTQFPFIQPDGDDAPSVRHTIGHTIGRAASMDASAGQHNLEEEVVFLRRKVQYLQSVSTVFRQKVALVLRECRKDPAVRFDEFERLYHSAMGEMAKAELIEFSPEGPQQLVGPATAFARAAADNAAPFAATSASGFAAEVLRYQRAWASKDDIKRTHHLCTILQEKNETKAREVQLRHQLDALKTKHAELEERFAKLVELQSTGSGPAAAHLEIWARRERELQQELVAAKTEIQRITTAGPQNIVYEHAAVSDVALQKQHQLLKGRFQKLKQDFDAVEQRQAEGAEEQQRQLEGLTDRMTQLREELRKRDAEVEASNRQRNDLAKEVIHLRSQHELLEARAAAMGKERELLMSEKPFTTEMQQDLHSREMDAAVKRLRVLESTIIDLQDELATQQTISREKDVKIDSLGSQIQSFKARLEDLTDAAQQRDHQQTALTEFQERLHATMDEMQSSHFVHQIQSQMGAVTDRIRTLEGIEMQLRHKEDELAVAKDQAESSAEAMNEMRQALLSISTLYTKFPISATQMERIVIELEEYKGEVVRCSHAGEVPDAVRVEGVVDLRCLDAQTAKQKHSTATVRGASKGRAGQGEARKTDAAAGLLDDDAFGETPPRGGGFAELDPALLKELPPPPSMPVGLAVAAATPRRSEMPGVSAHDARLTFQLFDERGSGRLSSETARLCLATLGLPVRLLPDAAKELSAEEFVALCTAPVAH